MLKVRIIARTFPLFSYLAVRQLHILIVRGSSTPAVGQLAWLSPVESDNMCRRYDNSRSQEYFRRSGLFTRDFSSL